MVDLENKVALVTGAGGMRGIGRAIALRLARAGAEVVLVDVVRPPEQLPDDEVQIQWQGIESVAAEISALGRRALPLYADIADETQVDKMRDAAVAALGGVDILINNARAVLAGDRAPVVDLPPAEWDRVMAVNARGTFLCSQAIARHLIQHGKRGKIINIASLAGKRGYPGLAAYSSSKFAIVGFTQTLALELAPYGINVNAVCPGLVDTGRYSLEEKAAAEEEGVPLHEYQRQRLEREAKTIPLGRVATPEDVANAVAYLVSSESDYITGQAINVDGGTLFH